MSELTRLTLKAALDGLKSRAFSSEELTGAFITAIEAANPRLNAFAVFRADQMIKNFPHV